MCRPVVSVALKNCCVCRDKCVEAGTLSDMAVPLGDWVMHALPSKEDVLPRYPDTVDRDCS